MRSTEVLSLKGRRTADCEIAQDFRPTFHHGKCRGEAGRTNNTRLQEVFYGKRPSLVQKHARKRKRLHHTSTAPVAPQNYQLTSCSQPTCTKALCGSVGTIKTPWRPLYCCHERGRCSSPWFHQTLGLVVAGGPNRNVIV